MSQPPPYGAPNAPPPNPDTRSLPQGWIQQYDHNYKVWFYVNTAENPPRSSWTHPLGPAPTSPPPSGYAPPSGPPPPDNRGYNSSPYPQQGGYNQGPGGYNQGGYGQQSPPQQQWGGPPPGGYGGPPQGNWQGGGYNQDYGQQPNRGWFGGGQSHQQSPVVYAQAPPKKSGGPGMGTALLAGGAGLVGGALIADAWDDHEDNIQENAYADGYQDGQDGDFDGGDW